MNENTPKMIDETLAKLIAVAAATAANAGGILRETLSELQAAGVPGSHILGAVEIGNVVKERPAIVMKEAADVLTGSRLSPPPRTGECPAKAMPEGAARKAAFLMASGAAMAANCEPCLNKAVLSLIEGGVAEADLRKAVEIGQEVKDRAANRLLRVVGAGVASSHAPMASAQVLGGPRNRNGAGDGS